jgi:RNA polymerase subunit RPABC4/transcription elongation factor Spt4
VTGGRILYWTSFAIMVVALLYAMSGWNTSSSLAAKSSTQTGAAMIAAIALVGLMLGKFWLDRVVRSRSYLPCPACQTLVHFSALHCPKCGLRLRTAVREAFRSTAPVGQSGGTSSPCPRCGRAAAPGIQYCSACGEKLANDYSAALD